jgi:hypothetical protein
MKAYTDIEQSRRLAKILLIESADMAWCNNSIRGVNYTDEYSANLYTIKEMKECFDKALNGWDKYWKLIPCWSLAALLNCLREVGFFPYIEANKHEVVMSVWDCDREFNITHFINVKADNFVDACVELIIKLNEQKIL